MSEPAASLASIDADGNGICVEFTKQIDRFEHTVLTVRAGDKIPVLRSIEGTPEDYAPPSPPYAELHQQDSVLFLSGATTIAHWSMSLEVVEQQIVFDVACRMKSGLEVVGSEYELLTSQHAELLQLMPAETAHRESHEESIRIVPVSPHPVNYPGTSQWRYSIGFNSL